MPAFRPSKIPLDSPAVVDLRDSDAYARERPVGAVRLFPDDLVENPHMLPPRSRGLVIVGETTAHVTPILQSLEQAGRNVIRHHPGDTWRDHLDAETGPPSKQRLWEPAYVVEQAVEIFVASGRRLQSPSKPVALDLACGTGRNAVYLALEGFDVTAIDILPDALTRTSALAARHSVSVRTTQRDLEKPGALDDQRADFIVVVRFLERSLFPAIKTALAPGGLLAYETFTESQQEIGHPRNPRFFLRRDELRTAFPQLEIVLYESVFDDAHIARLLARQPISKHR